MFNHPTLDQLRGAEARRHGRRLSRQLEQQDAARDLTTPNGSHSCSIERSPIARPSARRAPAAAARLRHSQAAVEDVDLTARNANSTKRSSSSSRPAAGSRKNEFFIATGKCGLGNLARLRPFRGPVAGYRAYYARMPRLFAQLELAHGDGGLHASSACSPKSICSFWTTSVPTASMLASSATSWRSSRIAMAAPRR